ncbi:MAG: glycosyltransferase [Chloroflexota bacterium]|nr:glycosyltransferase [Chloroflexota bacterium]MDE2911210.1 glycosyltransferase [Chloroflexota bacterium]
MKLLALVSSLDLRQPFSATPAWWQLLKGLYELETEVIAAPYQGVPVESLWWRSEANPARLQGDVFKSVRDLSRSIMPMRNTGSAKLASGESLSDRAVRQAANKLIAPLWKRQLERILARERDVDAVLFLTVPPNHLRGVPRYISRKFNVPVFHYDGDVPASLPNLSGFASGFRIYQGADLSEYTAFISNSAGGASMLEELGASNAHTLWYGADPDVFAPISTPTQDIDVFFYGHGREYRSDWIDRMIAKPSMEIADSRFAVRGTKLGDLGAARQLPYLSFSKLREYVCRSKLNLCVTRGAHANVYASSSSRPFELGALGACIVANPYLGIEEWFEPGKELIIVRSAEEAIERYQYLLRNESERKAIGSAARQRVLKQHTFRHRARELLRIIKMYI